MDEAIWLASTDPGAMLRHLTYGGLTEEERHLRPSSRKLRLFACACARQLWHLLTDPRSRRAVETAERFADSETTGEELRTAWAQASEWASSRNVPSAEWVTWTMALDCATTPERLSAGLTWACAESVGNPGVGVPPATQAALLRCLFGNPWRPVRVESFWRTHAALALARAAYAREWDALGPLADAMEEAGCPGEVECHLCGADSYELDAGLGGRRRKCPHCRGTGRVPNPVLAHLRGPGPHAKGCWVVDLILGKE